MARLDQEHENPSDLLLMRGQIGLNERVEWKDAQLVISDESRYQIHHQQSNGELFLGLQITLLRIAGIVCVTVGVVLVCGGDGGEEETS